MDIDNILKFIGLIAVLEDPEKFQNLINSASKSSAKEIEHGYYSLKTGNKYNGEVYIHGNGEPFTDGHGNVIIWR